MLLKIFVYYQVSYNFSDSWGFAIQIVHENTLMQHHVALPPGSMGKISYIAPAGQYSLKVFLLFSLLIL